MPPERPPPPYCPGAPPPYNPSHTVYPAGPAPPAGAAPYGVPPPWGAFYSPPPAYHQGFPEGYPAGYPPGYPPPSQPDGPPMNPGGYSLYPDVSLLPQPEAVQGGRGNPTPPKFSPRIPVRPAPAPPCQSPGDLTSMGPPLPDHTSTGPVQNTNELPLKEGEAPPGCVVAWRGGEGLKVFFLQQEGHIVSPHRPLLMTIYKKIGGSPCEGNENLVGMVEVPGCWRLRLTGSTHVLHTSENAYIFNDNSTCPKRVVVLELPANVSKTMEADLLALMNELTDLRDEEEGVVGKIATGVSTVYTDLTKKLNTVVKETVPGAHKSTKWLRKGTGSLVRMGGSIVSKGIHMIADHVSVNENPQLVDYEDSPVHTELLTALKQVKKCKEDGFITYV
ncbi:vegetative cell wall protein gp1-like isoform X5 [Homarus americanus]|uniref:vegetative cell wall protein gp1-like isoform X5 n=1 Tax=Homarus americanus TaxID=6706 RepID=UPI001C49258E|nr:vegetative cell wall protein gp1-like isoform X5 [Homarus americanus]